MKIKTKKIIVLCLISLIMSLGCLSCGNNSNDVRTTTENKLPESFSFFGVGINTTLSSELKSELKSLLGSDSTQARTVIDLAINYPGFFNDFFPDIHALNQQLNFPPRERVEHNTLKLMYRYAIEKNLSFDYVEFLFSGYSRLPLMIKIFIKKEMPDIRETLENKYGEPTSIHWKQDHGSSLYWKKNHDLLILSRVPDPQGNPTRHQIVILFPERIKELQDAEHDSTQKKSSLDTKKKKAF